MARVLEGEAEIRTRREKIKNVNYQFDSNNKKDPIKGDRRVNVPEYHFYDNRQKLIELMEKED